ncbi:hypothetical protein IWW50_002044 [Coemansia erecta]|nr:hypothetical protein IWW50_002044 [Coemansia erecta]
MASDFVHPRSLQKADISQPVKAEKMGDVDFTANDCVFSRSAPSSREVHLLEKHVKETAHALRTSRKKVLRDALA